MLIKRSKIPIKSVITIGILPSFAKKLIYRLKGYSIGKNVSIGLCSVIIGKNVVIGNNVKIGLLSIIRGEEIKIDRFTSIGSFTVIDSGKIIIGEDSRINEQVIVGGMKTPQSSLRLGKRTIIMEYSFINTTMPIEIGDDTGIGGHCLLFTHGSWLNQLEGYPVTFAPIKIGKNVWLPWRVFLMPGTSIGDNVVIGANSLVSHTIPSNVLIAGSPAKIIKENFPLKLTEEQRNETLSEIFKDFCDYLTFFGYQIQKETINNADKYIITKDKHNHLLYYLQSHSDRVIRERNTIVVQDFPFEFSSLKLPKGSMIINLKNKERIGTSNIGEEFTKFLSRYGIRFDRFD